MHQIGMMNHVRRTFVPALFLALLAHGSLSIAGAPEITVTEQKAVLSPMIVGAGAAFMKIVNAGSGDDILASARTDMPGAIVELHYFEDGKMTQRKNFPIPAKSTVVLRPGDLHIMFFKLPKSVKEGTSFSLTLVFEKSGEMNIPLHFTTPSHPSSHQ